MAGPVTLKNKSIPHEVLLMLAIREVIVKVGPYNKINLRPLTNIYLAP